MDNRILELCKSVANTSLNELELCGVRCGVYDVDCHECPFWWKNRDDEMECYESKNKTREIARKYIKDNENNKKESDNVDNKILKLCKSVANSSLDTLKLYNFDCRGINCRECPFCRENRDDGMSCYENKNKIQEIARKYIEDNKNNKKESDNMDNRILELCKSVANSSLDELELRGVKCGMYNVDCHECPFWYGNRDDEMECYENKNKTQEIARKYIEDNENNKKGNDNMNSKIMKIIDIFNNWDNFKVDTEFYYEGIKDAVFLKDRYNDVVFKNDIYDFSLDSELIVKEPVEYVNFDDIKIGEEFIIEDEDDGCMLDVTYVKVEAFNGIIVLEKGCDGNIFVVDIDLSKTNGFKFRRK